MLKDAFYAVCVSLCLWPVALAAQDTNGGNGGSGGGVICNNCTINGGSLSGGGGGIGGSASSSPENNAQISDAHSIITSFRIEIRLAGGQSILTRNWRRAQNKWVEIYPEGKKNYFDIVGASIVNGCKGVIAKSNDDIAHKVFIADRGCEGMPFYIKDRGKAWGFASEMYDVR